MTIEIRVPQLPESITDATLVGWHKQPGEPVSRDENLADLETDKVVLEVPAPANGILRELKVQGGATVTSGQLLAVLEERTAAAKGAAPQQAAAPQPAASSQPSTAPRAAASPQPAAAPQHGASSRKTGSRPVRFRRPAAMGASPRPT